MADNLKWYKVWTSITDDPDFLEMPLESLARWVLLGAYIRKHGYSGKITLSKKILSHLLRTENLQQDLEKLHNVIIENNCNDSMSVTFKNWYKYQIDDSSQRVAIFRQNVTNKDKIRLDKIKIRKDKDKDTLFFSLTSNEVRLSELLLSLIVKRNPTHKKPNNIQTWAKEIDKMIRIDKRTVEDIEKIIRWCQEDTFWQNNILSTKKLREKFDQLKLKSQTQTQGGGEDDEDDNERFNFSKGNEET